MKHHLLTLLLILALGLTACSGRETTSPSEAAITVVATTSIVANVVQQIGGEHVTVISLLPLGADPHTYQPRPQDVQRISQAKLIFANGAGLEEFLHNLLENANALDKVKEVSEGIELLSLDQVMASHEEEHHEEEEHHHQGGDPHTWMDPNNVMIWVDNIVVALSAVDPAHAATYRSRGEAYKNRLRELDAWIVEQVNQIPPANRLLVTDHATFGYFAHRYGFRQVGILLPSFSSQAAPSAQELTSLVEQIRSSGAKAIFVGEDTSDQLARQIAEESGVRVVRVYHASLTPPDGPAPDYLAYMRYNVSAIVEALR